MAVAVILAPFNFNGRVIILWSVWRIGTLGDDTVELLSDVPHPLLQSWIKLLATPGAPLRSTPGYSYFAPTALVQPTPPRLPCPFISSERRPPVTV